MRVLTVLKLLGASLAVGLLMTAFDVAPGDVYDGLARWLVAGWRWFLDAWRWLVGQLGGRIVASLLAGATIVVPLWLLFRFVRLRRRRG